MTLHLNILTWQLLCRPKRMRRFMDKIGRSCRSETCSDCAWNGTSQALLFTTSNRISFETFISQGDMMNHDTNFVEFQELIFLYHRILKGAQRWVWEDLVQLEVDIYFSPAEKCSGPPRCSKSIDKLDATSSMLCLFKDAWVRYTLTNPGHSLVSTTEKSFWQWTPLSEPIRCQTPWSSFQLSVAARPGITNWLAKVSYIYPIKSPTLPPVTRGWPSG